MIKEKFIYYISTADDIFRNGKLFDKACDCYKKARDLYDLLDESAKHEYSSLMDKLTLKYCDYIKNQAAEDYKKKNYRKALLLYEDLMFLSDDEQNFPFFAMADCQKQQGALKTAIYTYKKGLEFSPSKYDVFRIIGDLYSMLKSDCESDEEENVLSAIQNYEEYCRHYFNNASVYAALARAYARLRDEYSFRGKQLEYLQKALEIKPDSFENNKNLALFYADKENNFEMAKKYFDKALSIFSNHDYLFLYATFLIKYKCFSRGWALYEHRLEKETNQTPYPKINKPLWRGEDIPDKTLLVSCEQGFGDSIMFLRFIEQITGKAKRVIFRVHDALYSLIKDNNFSFDVIKESENLENIDFDCHIPLLDIPHIINLQPETIPSSPYLKADEEKVLYFKNKYFNHNKLKIGFVWRGNPKFYNKNRDLPVSAVELFSTLKDAEFYSFQLKIDKSEFRGNIHPVFLGDEFKDFSYTAAALKNLDYLVSSDNGVLHLAGALGVKTLCLLNCDAEYRWMNEEGKCSWYDSLTIFRQTWDKSWDNAVKAAVEYIKCH